MLKRFIVENFSSFRDETFFDLTAGKTEINNSHFIDFGNTKILKSAIIYGANASGKSNLIKAIHFANKIITEGIENTDTYKKYFRLDAKYHSKPTKFEFEIEINEKFYSYGFSVQLKSKNIQEEWLYQIGVKSPEKIFERNLQNISLGKKLSSEKIKNRFEIYKDDIKHQTQKLFLSEIANKQLTLKAVEEINAIYTFFDDMIFVYPDTKFGINIEKDDIIIDLYKKYLSKFDTGIFDLEAIEEDFEKISKTFPERLTAEIEKKLKIGDIAEIKTPFGENFLLKREDDSHIKVTKVGLIHGTNTNKEIFELKDESDGTIRLLDLIPLIGLFQRNMTIIIDEFDRSLHPRLTKKFLEMFFKETSRCQIILTTHESTLLDLDLMRRDEIWFIEKSSEGNSILYSLEQFKERYDKKIEKAYLMGRYGAIPIFKDFDNLEENE